MEIALVQGQALSPPVKLFVLIEQIANPVCGNRLAEADLDTVKHGKM